MAEDKHTTRNDSNGEAIPEQSIEINIAGYKDQLSRQYSLIGLTGMAVTVNNAWVVLGSSISISILNGGPSGVIYGLIVAVFYYTFIGLSLAELASSFPSSGGVYHWASLAAGPRWGHMAGFFTGWINFYGWMFGLASLVQVAANTSVQLYAVYDADFIPESWHVYTAYILVVLLGTMLIILTNRKIPYTQHLGLFLVVVGGLITIIVVSVSPPRHASNGFVWGSFKDNNLTGWNDGVAFMLGVLNGAFTIGTPDSITHMADEVKSPERVVPKAILLQIGLGGLYSIAFAIALGYAISDITILQTGVNTFPLAGIYMQATGSPGATFALLFIIFLSSLCCCIGTILTNSRSYWVLARDNAVPFSRVFSRVNEPLSCPIEATLLVAVLAIGIGAIPLGSPVGFANLTGSFIIISTISYGIPFTCNILSRRKRFVPGPFKLGRAGFLVNGIAVLLIILFDILFCFPLALPFDAHTMNYNCVIVGGVLAITLLWWKAHASTHYPGPAFDTRVIYHESY